MPVTTLHKLIGLSVAMLGQAPGTDLLNQWTRLYTQSREDGMDAMAALQKVHSIFWIPMPLPKCIRRT